MKEEHDLLVGDAGPTPSSTVAPQLALSLDPTKQPPRRHERTPSDAQQCFPTPDTPNQHQLLQHLHPDLAAQLPHASHANPAAHFTEHEQGL